MSDKNAEPHSVAQAWAEASGAARPAPKKSKKKPHKKAMKPDVRERGRAWDKAKAAPKDGLQMPVAMTSFPGQKAHARFDSGFRSAEANHHGYILAGVLGLKGFRPQLG